MNHDILQLLNFLGRKGSTISADLTEHSAKTISRYTERERKECTAATVRAEDCAGVLEPGSEET